MLQQLSIAIRVTVLSVLALGLLYPVAMTGIIHVIVPGGPNPDLIGQSFSKPQYFWGRPSAAGKGSIRPHLRYQPGPTSKKLMTRLARPSRTRSNPRGAPPMDLRVERERYRSDIKPRRGYQVARVATARKSIRPSCDRSSRERSATGR